jgi:hypothetical protein
MPLNLLGEAAVWLWAVSISDRHYPRGEYDFGRVDGVTGRFLGIDNASGGCYVFSLVSEELRRSA